MSDTKQEQSEAVEAQTISAATRRDIFDLLGLDQAPWSGRLDELEFLGRLYDLSKLPSNDDRFQSAEGDIWQHRVNNRDWENHWVFDDARFRLATGPDDLLLRFLAQTLHPFVRPEQEEAKRLADLYNERLRRDGWELFQAGELSERPVYEGRRIASGTEHAVKLVRPTVDGLQAAYVDQQVKRMMAAVENDPALAIGTAKELIETVCRSILAAHNQPPNDKVDVQQLVKATAKQIGLVPDGIPESAKGAEAIRILLHTLGTVATKLAEIRNLYGTGHGRKPGGGLQPRHARLAVGAASTLASFFVETHQARAMPPGRKTPSK